MMEESKAAAGNPLSFGDMHAEADVRTLGELSQVLFIQESVSGLEDEPAYFMYRDLGKTQQDREKISAAGLRYDITVIPPRSLGIEYIKTSGHFHPTAAGTDVAYPELYQVLAGRAHYLLQKRGADGVAEDAVFIEAVTGEMVLIPPGYGHVTINPKRVNLKIANWVARGFSSQYELVEKMRGAAYYETVEDNWIPNTRYNEPAALRRRRPTDPALFGLKEREDMYGLVGDLGRLDLLLNPQNHLDLFVGMP